ncbi:MAG: lysophospholipid acyltransferase family protein [Patescibacteria group bacterium]|jgi:1-acyl-sn-glycerol-3-phosphate acyltransferase
MFNPEKNQPNFDAERENKKSEPNLKMLEKNGEKDWTYEKWQKMLKFVVEKFWGDKFKVSGKENIPEKDSAIIAVNHSSHVDPEFLMAGIDRPMHFVGLQDKEFNPLYVKIFYKLMGVIPVSRNLVHEGGKDFIKQVKQAIENKELICIFPEGMLEEKKDRTEINEFKSGVAKIAKKYGLDVIPVYMSGTDKVIPNSTTKMIQKINIEPVEIKIGDKISAKEIQDEEQIRQEIINLIPEKK